MVLNVQTLHVCSGHIFGEILFTGESPLPQWTKAPKKPAEPVHPWLLDRRVRMHNLSEDERYKHEYYILRAYEAGFPVMGLHKQSARTQKSIPKPANPAPPSPPPQPDSPIQLDPRPSPPPFLAPDENVSNSLSQGAGPNSLDLDAFMRQQEKQKVTIQKRLAQRRERMLQRKQQRQQKLTEIRSPEGKGAGL